MNTLRSYLTLIGISLVVAFITLRIGMQRGMEFPWLMISLMASIVAVGSIVVGLLSYFMREVAWWKKLDTLIVRRDVAFPIQVATDCVAALFRFIGQGGLHALIGLLSLPFLLWGCWRMGRKYIVSKEESHETKHEGRPDLLGVDSGSLSARRGDAASVGLAITADGSLCRARGPESDADGGNQHSHGPNREKAENDRYDCGGRPPSV